MIFKEIGDRKDVEVICHYFICLIYPDSQFIGAEAINRICRDCMAAQLGQACVKARGPAAAVEESLFQIILGQGEHCRVFDERASPGNHSFQSDGHYLSPL